MCQRHNNVCIGALVDHCEKKTCETYVTRWTIYYLYFMGPSVVSVYRYSFL